MVFFLALSAFAADPESPSPAPRKEWEWAALPIASASSNTGVGFGAFGAIVHTADHGSSAVNAAESGRDIPYRARITAQVYFTTKAYQDHFLKADFPDFRHSGVRWDLEVGYERWKQTPYFGVGNATPRVFELYDSDSGGDPRYYQYDVSWLRVLTNLRGTIGESDFQWFAGYLLRVADVNVYEDSLVDQVKPEGYEGGRGARLSAGAMYDTRDAEPSPHHGSWIEASARVSHPVVGSQWSSYGFNFTDRHYISIDKNSRVVLATEAILDAERGDEPLFMLPLMGGSRFMEIGSSKLMRGLDQSRINGDWAAFGIAEVRVTWLQKGKLSLIEVPFFDVGRVGMWTDSDAFDANDPAFHLHYGGGLGTRVQLGQSMLVRLDIGYAREELTHTDGSKEGKPQLGFYLVFDHPF